MSKIPSSGKFRRGYKGGRRSTDINSRPTTDAYRAGWERTFGQGAEKPKQKDENG